jgi:hypothetical protein
MALAPLAVLASQAPSPSTVVLALPEKWWFAVGCVAFGLAVGLWSTATLVVVQHRTRESAERASDASEFVHVVLWQVRGLSPDAVGRDLSGGPRAAELAAAAAVVPGLVFLLAVGRCLWWVVANTPPGVGSTVQFVYGVMFITVPFALAAVGLVVPVCVGVVTYLDTLMRAWAVLAE